MNSPFTIRRDRLGLRAVFNLGNERGHCPFACDFCSVGFSERTDPTDNILTFDSQLRELSPHLTEPFRALVYNQGNVTSPSECSRSTLSHILNALRGQSELVGVSLNSRAALVDDAFLSYLDGFELCCPVHFIFGVESFAPRAADLLGKRTEGEMDRFVECLVAANRERSREGGYAFGLDVNLVFLPELYLEPGEGREGNNGKITEGMLSDLAQLLQRVRSDVPVQVNLHPYHEVPRLPFANLDMRLFMEALPAMAQMVESHNRHSGARFPTYLFIGVEGEGFDTPALKEQMRPWHSAIADFNSSGDTRKIERLIAGVATAQL